MWAKQIEAAVCLINGKAVNEDSELLSGPVSFVPSRGLLMMHKFVSPIIVTVFSKNNLRRVLGRNLFSYHFNTV